MAPPSGAAMQALSRRRIVPTAVPSAAHGQRLLAFSGFITRDPGASADVDLDPWQSFHDNVDVIVDTTDTFTVVALDAAGQTLATTALKVAHDLPGGKAIKAEVPLGEMFGYSTTLRSLTQGRATYTMEFKHYAEAPKSVADSIIKKDDDKDRK